MAHLDNVYLVTEDSFVIEEIFDGGVLQAGSLNIVLSFALPFYKGNIFVYDGDTLDIA